MTLIKTIIGGLVVAAVSGVVGYLIKSRLTPGARSIADPHSRSSSLDGAPLSATSFYPVRSSDDGQIILDKQKFLAAITALLEKSNPKAASDLIYLGDANLDALSLSEHDTEAYKKLKNKYRTVVERTLSNSHERSALFARYREMVHGIGDTFQGLPIEIVLHDTRDPLHSVVTVRNPITGRKIDDPTTDFGIRLIQCYSRHGCVGNQAGYRLIAPDGREFKSTTIPIDHDVFGLIGFICVNMDINQLAPDSKPEMNAVLEKLTETPMGLGNEVLFAADEPTSSG